MTPTKFSVIMPIYKVENYLRQSIESVLAQSFRNFELILVDDGSPDRCGAICDEYAGRDSRILVIHKENGGVSSARNAGLKRATGDWLYFMDPDDWIEPNTLDRIRENIENTHSDMVFFRYQTMEGDRSVVKSSLKLKDDSVERSYFDLNDADAFYCYCAFGSMCACAVRRVAVAGRVVFNESLSIGEDHAFRFQLYGQIRSFSYMPDVLYHYRVVSGSACNQDRWELLFLEQKKTYLFEREFLQNARYPMGAERALKSYHLNTMLRFLGMEMMRAGKTRDEKKEKLRKLLESELYCECVNGYAPELLGGTASVIMRLGEPTVGRVRFANWIKRRWLAFRALDLSRHMR